MCLPLCFLLLLLLPIFVAPDEDNLKSFFFPCVSLCFVVLVNTFLSSVLSVLSSSPVVVQLIPQKKNVFFHIHEITRVVVLYTSLRFVEGVYKPQRACVVWTSVTESCFEAWMWIKRTFLDEFPLGHPKMFERTLDVISLFVLAISNTINLFPNFLCCSLWKR